ncbi:heterogeneous nuclear ribonucleoprotein D-like-A [Oncorhynchus nerka]|uniref:heterogeneous nuclear ribonucleoprotein D-like-A n=1 Tax=Oncorhynchus nerka TaxID=8023 RepID=UPI00113162A7|nr:heterogeneous nuclear ribonucleoprotein D-like-A isoform X2 [Oncorhynchus nerka]
MPAKNEEDEGKMCVGLELGHNKEGFEGLLQVWGGGTLKLDPMTGRSRGFDFVLFKAADSVDKLNGKVIDPKKVKAMKNKEPNRKVFVEVFLQTPPRRRSGNNLVPLESWSPLTSP